MNFSTTHCETNVCEKNKSLERAVNARNCNEVKFLISNGANINHTVNQNLDTMLHLAKSEGIARDLLGYSANVNAINLYERTPLHLAVIDGKGKQMVLTLLQHGAMIDTKDSQGNTPLNYAVKSQVKDFDTMKTLVMNGADVGLKKDLDLIGNYCYPLQNAFLMNDVPSIKVLIAYTLLNKASEFLKTFRNKDLSQCLNITPYFRCPCYPLIKNYIHLCCMELKRMEREKLNKLTLLQTVTSPYIFRESLGNNEDQKYFAINACEIMANHNYSIYKDVIFNKLKIRVDKSALIKILCDIQIYTKADKCISNDGNDRITLNSDVTNLLAKYLSSEDLFSFILAFYVTKKDNNMVQSIKNLSEIRKNFNKRLCEDTSSVSCSKYLKKDTL